jgi:hypothetical protein
VMAQSPGALHYSSVELVVLRWEQGTLEELEQPLRELKERTGAAIWRAALALLCSEIDEEDWARTELDALTADRCAAVPFDENWLATLAFLGMTCANFGDTKRAAELHELLEPYRGHFIVIGAAAACLGPVSHFLGWLASIEGDWQAAVALLEQASEESRAAGSELWLARARFRLGLALRARANSEDQERSGQLISEAGVTAERLGMGRLSGLIARTEPGYSSPEESPSRARR